MKDEIICIWPDNTWCDFEDLESILKWKSDDYEIITLQEAIKKGLVDPEDDMGEAEEL